MRAGGFPGNPGGLVVSIVKTAGRRQRSAGGWTARSRRVSEYRRSGGIEPTRPRGGKGAPAGGTGGGKDGQHTEVGSRLHVTTPESRPGQISLGDGGGHRLASWTSGYATARSEAICRGAGCGRTRTSGSVGGQGQQRPWSTRPLGRATADQSDHVIVHHEPAQHVRRVRLLGHVERIPLEAVELARVVELPRVRRQHEEVGLDVGTRDDVLREVLRRDRGGVKVSSLRSNM